MGLRAALILALLPLTLVPGRGLGWQRSDILPG